MVIYPAKITSGEVLVVICTDLSKIHLMLRYIANGRCEVGTEMQNMWISLIQNEYVYHSLSV